MFEVPVVFRAFIVGVNIWYFHILIELFNVHQISHWRILGGEGCLGTRAPSQSNFFHFHAVFGKNLAK